MSALGRKLAGLLALAVAIYAGLCALLYVNQRSQMYFPTSGRADVPSMVLRNEGLELLVSLGRGNDVRASSHAVVYFGGNAEDVSYTTRELASVFDDAAIYAPHYRGYGGSEGSPSEDALVSDGLALFDQVRARHPRITLIGRSLGSGVAVQVAAKRTVERLVLVTPFDSMVSVAAGHFPLFPVRWLLRDRYPSDRFAPGIRAPVTLVVAGSDRIVPPEHALRLADAFSGTRPEVVVLDRAGHNDVDAFPGYHEALRGR